MKIKKKIILINGQDNHDHSFLWPIAVRLADEGHQVLFLTEKSMPTRHPQIKVYRIRAISQLLSGL